MDNKNPQNGENTIDLVELFFALLKHIKMILLIAIIGAVIGFAYSEFLITPLYEADALMIASSYSTQAAQADQQYVSSDQINSSASLVDTYAIIITSDTVMDDVKNNVGLTEEEYKEVVSSVEVSAVNDTQVMQISVQSADPQVAMEICEEITNIAPNVIIETAGVGSVKVLSNAELANEGEQVSPNVMKNTAIGGAVGLVLICLIISALSILNNKVKNENDIKDLNLPLLGIIPVWKEE